MICANVPDIPANSAPAARWLAARRAAAAFTLIELLVVVAVIAILIAILIPSLSRAREHTRLVLCQANLHGQLQAHQIYGGSFSDQKPPLLLPSFTPGGPPLKSEFNSPDTKWFSMVVGQGILAANHYVDFKQLLCPSGSMALDREIDENSWNSGITSGSSYTYYWRDINDIKTQLDWNQLMTYGRCANAHHQAITMDVNLDAGHSYTGEYQGRAWVSHPDQGKTNIGFIDGSVSSVPNTQVVLHFPAGNNEQIQWWSDAESAK